MTPATKIKPTDKYAVSPAEAAAIVSVGMTGFRPHDLRHSCASFLLAEGVSLKTVSGYLGHANATITLRTYAHLLPGQLDDAAERMDRILNPPSETDNDLQRGAK